MAVVWIRFVFRPAMDLEDQGLGICFDPRRMPDSVSGIFLRISGESG